jgi:hypothetical protein
LQIFSGSAYVYPKKPSITDILTSMLANFAFLLTPPKGVRHALDSTPPAE